MSNKTTSKQLYKTLRNTLRKYPYEDIFLFCWSFSHYLISGKQLPQQIPNHQYYNQKKGNDMRTWTEEGIYPWLIDLLFREYITHYEKHPTSPRTLLSGNRIPNTLNLIQEISNQLVAEHKTEKASDIESYLWRLQYQQFIWQDIDLQQQYLRYYIFYSDPELKSLIKTEIDADFDIDKIFLIGGLFYRIFLESFSISLPISKPAEELHITKEEMELFVNKFMITLDELVSKGKKISHFDEGFEFKFNPLRRNPLVIADNKMFCPEPMFLVDLMTKNLRYLILEQKKQGSANRRFGEVFEEYCVKLAKGTLGGSVDVYKDDNTKTKDGTPKTVDIILDDTDITIFGECKSGYIYKDPYNESLNKAIEQITEYLAGAYFSLSFYKENKYPQIKYHKTKQKVLLLILLDDIHVLPRFDAKAFQADVNQRILEINQEKNRKIDQKLLKEIPWKICSIREYEYFLAQVKDKGLKNTFENSLVKENPYILRLVKRQRLDIGEIYGIDNNVFKILKEKIGTD